MYDRIDGPLAEFIERQPLFFVATAPLDGEGLLNCSPKGNRHELVVTAPDRVVYLDQTGSGIETVAHLGENGRIVVMVCAFEGPPRIVRVHGNGLVHRRGSPGFAALADHFPGSAGVGVRSVIDVAVTRVADSCGYGVPLMTLVGHRKTMDEWSSRKGTDGIAVYQAENNARSIEGLEGLEGLDGLDGLPGVVARRRSPQCDDGRR